MNPVDFQNIIKPLEDHLGQPLPKTTKALVRKAAEAHEISPQELSWAIEGLIKYKRGKPNTGDFEALFKKARKRRVKREASAAPTTRSTINCQQCLDCGLVEVRIEDVPASIFMACDQCPQGQSESHFWQIPIRTKNEHIERNWKTWAPQDQCGVFEIERKKQLWKEKLNISKDFWAAQCHAKKQGGTANEQR